MASSLAKMRTSTIKVSHCEALLSAADSLSGITPQQMHSNFRGEAIYSAEQDIHFPQLTVGDTLGFAAEARAPREPPGGMKKHEYGQIMRDVVMASLGISHTINTKVRIFLLHRPRH
jgi:ATP-binding cassette subfamily G (WHITE) protein 2 (PDR)